MKCTATMYLTFVEEHHHLLKHFHEGHVIVAVFLKDNFFVKLFRLQTDRMNDTLFAIGVPISL